MNTIDLTKIDFTVNQFSYKLLGDDYKYHNQGVHHFSDEEIMLIPLDKLKQNEQSNLLFFKTTKLGMQEAIVAVEYCESGQRLRHFNYYPQRKELTFTHETKNNLTDFGLIEELVQQRVTETFKSLERLLIPVG